ncbi:AraC family transcriptional regulator [Paenibacillus tarimensis]|uniref:AraC family transcriptional regulator n=1 Tax=Paenibacillus tarimensis TaxID=416012 RepID=UPI001F2FA9F4|nr:AraC family transcriptional regulator [Paenibacillus tarimensis]MCF2944838.1 AraC family transcriptional regulator [Paenibacillus tarimensis]
MPDPIGPKPHRRFVPSPSENHTLPLLVESIGLNPDQESITRPDGYPVYHWLQTSSGEGVIHFEDQTVRLPAGTGLLLFPHVPHSYAAADELWETVYLTFGGPAADSILGTLHIRQSAFFRWDALSPLHPYIAGMLSRLESRADVFGHDISADCYRFLLMLSRYGNPASTAGSSGNIERVRTMIEWMEANYSNPDIGLKDIAEVLPLSVRRLNDLFRHLFGLSPYAYFIQVRIGKAKELLVSSPGLTVRRIAEQVGFRDASHFVATFHKHVGIPPEQFRKLH